ncbi:MAG: AAA family ATPase [Alphaproteobacteria bacterium]|nr:AAA family ATPase [Alphaproteobacteria bacterium]
MIYRVKIDAFITTEETKSALLEAHENRKLIRSELNILKGSLSEAPSYYKDKSTPQILIVEETGDDEKMIIDLERLADVCEPTTHVIIIGKLNDISLYRKLMNEGISSYLLTPVSPSQILDTFDEILEDPESRPKGKLFSFYGVRGGVGSSTLAHNCAWTLAQLQKDKNVALIDTDLIFGTASIDYNVDTKRSIIDALSQHSRLDSILLEKFMVKYDENLMILGSPGNFRGKMDFSLDAFEKVIDLVREMATYVILDLPHEWNEWVEQMLINSDETIMVARPDLACFRNLKNTKEEIQKRRGKDNPIQLVLNFYDQYKKTQLLPKEIHEKLDTFPAAVFNFDTVFGDAATNGQMVGEFEPSSKASNLLKDFTIDFAEIAASSSSKKGFMKWLLGKEK